jgi:hypothetical protein
MVENNKSDNFKINNKNSENKLKDILEKNDFKKLADLSKDKMKITPKQRDINEFTSKLEHPTLEKNYNNLISSLKLKDRKLSFQSVNTDPQVNTRTVVAEFEQDGVIKLAEKDPKKYKNLHSSITRFNGLCEIISNFVMAKDLLGERHSSETFYKEINKNIDILEKEVSKTHILKIANVIELFMAFAFKKYPENIFTQKEQKEIYKDGNLNRSMIAEKLDSLPEGKYLKVFCLKRDGLSLQGHSLLVKKGADGKFAYFEPNAGAFYNLTKDSLFNKIEKSVNAFGGEFKEVCFLDAEKLAAKKPLLKQLIEKFSPTPKKKAGREI